MKPLLIKIFSRQQLEQLALELKPIFDAHPKVLFRGEVGAGKTTLIKALAKVYGVQGQVDSPTFSLVNEYVGETHISHFDLYRIHGVEELLDIGWEDYLYGEGQLWVEWPENAPEAFHEGFLLVNLEKPENPDERKIEVWEV